MDKSSEIKLFVSSADAPLSESSEEKKEEEQEQEQEQELMQYQFGNPQFSIGSKSVQCTCKHASHDEKNREWIKAFNKRQAIHIPFKGGKMVGEQLTIEGCVSTKIHGTDAVLTWGDLDNYLRKNNICDPARMQGVVLLETRVDQINVSGVFSKYTAVRFFIAQPDDTRKYYTSRPVLDSLHQLGDVFANVLPTGTWPHRADNSSSSSVIWSVDDDTCERLCSPGFNRFLGFHSKSDYKPLVDKYTYDNDDRALKFTFDPQSLAADSALHSAVLASLPDLEGLHGANMSKAQLKNEDIKIREEEDQQKYTVFVHRGAVDDIIDMTVKGTGEAPCCMVKRGDTHEAVFGFNFAFPVAETTFQEGVVAFTVNLCLVTENAIRSKG